MEGLKKRAYTLAAIFLIGGLGAHIAKPAELNNHDEKWMENSSLSSFGSYHMIPSDKGDPKVTYKMDKSTYEALIPSGIVCRELTDGSNTFDVVLVGSKAKDSFHDPRICFGAQGWNLTDESIVEISTKRGSIPFTITQIRSGDSLRWAAFAYRSPSGFVSNTNRLKLDLFTYSLLHSAAGEGVFYRFIGSSPGINRSELIKFIQDYMNASGKFSDGYF